MLTFLSFRTTQTPPCVLCWSGLTFLRPFSQDWDLIVWCGKIKWLVIYIYIYISRRLVLARLIDCSPDRSPSPWLIPTTPRNRATLCCAVLYPLVICRGEQKRRKELEIFLNRVAAHKELSGSQYFKTFLQASILLIYDVLV